MKSFKAQLSGSSADIRNARVNNFINIIRSQSEQSINLGEDSKQTYRELQIELEGALDIAPGTTVDLMSKLSTIDSHDLMSKVNSIAAKMLKVAEKIELKVILHNTMFPETPVTGLSDAELDFLKPLIRG